MNEDLRPDEVEDQEGWTEHVRLHPSGSRLADNGPWKPLVTGLEMDADEIEDVPFELSPDQAEIVQLEEEVFPYALWSYELTLTEAQQTRLGGFRAALRAAEASLRAVEESIDWMTAVGANGYGEVQKALQSYVSEVRFKLNAEEDKLR